MTRKYCRCGHAIWVESQWGGFSYVPVYLDDDEDSPTCGQTLSDRCPGCGESITSFRDKGFLFSEPPVDAVEMLTDLQQQGEIIEKQRGRIAELEAALKNILPYAKATEGRFKQALGSHTLLEAMHQNIVTAQALLEGGK